MLRATWEARAIKAPMGRRAHLQPEPLQHVQLEVLAVASSKAQEALHLTEAHHQMDLAMVDKEEPEELHRLEDHLEDHTQEPLLPLLRLRDQQELTTCGQITLTSPPGMRRTGSLIEKCPLSSRIIPSTARPRPGRTGKLWHAIIY